MASAPSKGKLQAQAIADRLCHLRAHGGNVPVVARPNHGPHGRKSALRENADNVAAEAAEAERVDATAAATSEGADSLASDSERESDPADSDSVKKVL